MDVSAQPLCEVRVPTFRRPTLLKRALLSLIDQTYSNWRCIVFDDCQEKSAKLSAAAKPLHATLARRALLRLDTMATSHPRPLGVPRSELPRLCPARLPRRPLQMILRYIGSSHFECLSV